METNFVDLNRMNLIYSIAEKLYRLYDKDFPSYIVGLDNAKKVFKLTKKEVRLIKKIIED